MICNPALLEAKYRKASFNSTGLNILRFIQMALAFIVIAWLNYGTFTYVMPYVPNYIRWGLFLAWFGLALTSNKKFAKTFCLQCWPLLFFYFYMLLISLFIEKDLKIYIKSISYLIMVYSIFLYYFDARYRKYQKFLCTFLFIDFIIIAINTYIHLQANPMIARYLSTGLETRDRLLGTAAFYIVGSYGYFYSLVSIILLLGFLFLNYHKKKLLSLLLIFTFIALLIRASFTLSILLTFIFLALLVIIHYTNKYTFIAITLLGVIMLLIFQGTFASMFGQLADIEGIPYDVSIRFGELEYFFSGKDVSGTDLDARRNMYLQSLDAFTNNTLIGIALNHSSAYSAGGHSAWLDLLATFGFFSIPFFIFLFKAYRYCKIRVPLTFRPFFKVYWLYYICLGLVGTLLFANIYTVWFLFLPLFISSFFEISEKRVV
jgi:hypothetical protein